MNNKKPLAFVLGGGGARGAMQVGALKALIEAEIYPEMLVGTSVGAVNAAYLGLKGITLKSVDELDAAWHEVAKLDLFPSNYLWLTVRAFFNRPSPNVVNRIKDFYISRGITPELRFEDMQYARVFLVAADLNNGGPVVYGRSPNQSVLEGLLASTALPPWVPPIEKTGQLLMDGGAVSTLPIEPALSQGAKDIIALDLEDFRDISPDIQGFGPFLAKLLNLVENRQKALELSLATERGVKVRLVHLQWEKPVPVWDFRHTSELIAYGYGVMRNEIETWKAEEQPWWKGWIERLRR